MTRYKRITFVTDYDNSYTLCGPVAIYKRSASFGPDKPSAIFNSTMTQDINLRKIKPFRQTEYSLTSMNKTENKKEIKRKNEKNTRKILSRSMYGKTCYNNPFAETKLSLNIPKKPNTAIKKTPQGISFIMDGTNEAEIEKCKVWKCKKDWLEKMKSLNFGIFKLY